IPPIQERLGERLARLTWSGEGVAAATALATDEEMAAPSVPLGAPVEWVQSAPLRPAAIETYTRCPQQYAYRYVYGLRPREVGMVTRRRSLHETLRTLEERFAGHAEGQSMHGGETREAEGRSVPSLTEALSLFEQRWAATLEREHSVYDNELGDGEQE